MPVLPFNGSKYDINLMKQFLDKSNDIFYLLKDSIVGGPSIIFNRYHEANKLKLED